MSVTTPEKKQPTTSPKKKTPKKDGKTPTKMVKTPKTRSLEDAEGRLKVKFSPKVMLFEGKMSLTESKAGLPDSPLATSAAMKKSNLKKRRGEDEPGKLTGKKTLDFEPVEVDKKVVKLKEKIKKRRELMKALPNRKGLGHVDPKTKKVIKRGAAAAEASSGADASSAGSDAPATKLVKSKKKAKVGKVGKAAKAAAVGGVRKAGAAGAKLKAAKTPTQDVVLKVKKKGKASDATAAAEAAGGAEVAAAASPKKKGEKRKRDDSVGGDDAAAAGNQKKVVVVDGGEEDSPKARPKVAATAAAAATTTPGKKTKRMLAKKPSASLSAKVYKKFHGKNTLSENQQKLAGMKKKERKTFRQQQKMGDNWSQLKEIKMIWESLRRASLDEAKRKTLTELLCQKIKGHVKTLSFMHDISRALQCLIKHATTEQRDNIFEEIKGDLVEMAKNKYAKNFIKRILDKSNKEQREVIISSFASHVPELAKHADASKVLEYSVANFSNASQRQAMVEEFYGPSYSYHKSPEYKTLEELLHAKPEARNSILDFMKAKVLSQVEKQSFTTQVVQKAALEFLRLAGTFGKPEARQEVIEHAREALVHVLHTHEGARIAMQCLWHGTAKDRKAILKSFKGHVVKVAMDEHGYQVLLAAIDVTDDTKMMSKALVEELAASSDSLTSVMESKHGRTVIYYLVHHRDPRHVHPDLLAILQAGDGNANSKKDPEIRRRELSSASLPHLLRHLTNHVPALMRTKKGAVAVYTILEAANGKEDEVAEAKSAFDAVIDLVAAPFDAAIEASSTNSVAGNGSEEAMDVDSAYHPIGDAGGHLCVKKIIQQNSAFASQLLARVTDDQLRSWTSCNRGCYVVLALVEHKDENVVERIKAALETVKDQLGASDFSGAKLLTTKL